MMVRLWILLLFPFLVLSSHAEEIAPAEQDLVDLINTHRESVGLPTVKVNAALCRINREHSYEMATNNVLTHRSAASGSTARDRIRKVQVNAQRFVEHIAKGENAKATHNSLLEDDKYLKNISDREFEEIGVGAFAGQDGHIFYTLLLTVPVREVDPEEATKTLLSSINARRRTQDLPEIDLHNGLASLAMETCQHMNKKGALIAGNVVKNGIKDAGQPYKYYRSFFRFTQSLDSVKEAEELYDARYRKIGLAILPNDHPRKNFGSYWVSVILVEPR